MNDSINNEIIDDDWDYDLSLWISTDKSLEEFEQSLSDIIYPVSISNHHFELGAIKCTIEEVNTQPLSYPGVPNQEYSFRIIVPIVTYLIWGLFDRQFALSLTTGMRSKFTCQYLITDDNDNFIMHSGTNLPVYINLNYPPWSSGELNVFRRKVEVVEIRI